MNDDFKDYVPYRDPTFKCYDLLTLTDKNNFEKVIDSYIENLDKQKIDINASSEYLNSIVDMYIKSLYNKLETKHTLTQNYINNLFTRRFTSKKELERMVEILNEEIVSTEEDYSLIKDLYERYNPLEQGRLNLKGIKTDLELEDGDGDDEKAIIYER